MITQSLITLFFVAIYIMYLKIAERENIQYQKNEFSIYSLDNHTLYKT